MCVNGVGIKIKRDLVCETKMVAHSTTFVEMTSHMEYQVAKGCVLFQLRDLHIYFLIHRETPKTWLPCRN